MKIKNSIFLLLVLSFSLALAGQTNLYLSSQQFSPLALTYSDHNVMNKMTIDFSAASTLGLEYVYNDNFIFALEYSAIKGLNYTYKTNEGITDYNRSINYPFEMITPYFGWKNYFGENNKYYSTINLGFPFLRSSTNQFTHTVALHSPCFLGLGLGYVIDRSFDFFMDIRKYIYSANIIRYTSWNSEDSWKANFTMNSFQFGIKYKF
jgi:hypothetical protein